MEVVEVFECIPDIFVLVDREWTIRYANAAAEQVAGFERAALIGTNLWTTFPELVGNAFEDLLRRAMADRVATRGEHLYPPLGLWFEAEIRPTSDEGLAVFARNTTDRRASIETAKQLARERDALLSRLQALFERIPLSIVVTDPDLKIIDWNPAAERVFGHRREDVIGGDAQELLLLPHTRLQLARVIERLREGHVEQRMINENMTKDGRVILCEWHTTPFYDAEGLLIAYFATAEDVTTRTAAECELRQNQSMLAEAEQVAKIGSWSMDVATGDVTWSNEHYRLLGLVPNGSATRQTVAERAHVDDRRGLLEAIDRALLDHRPFDVSWRAVHTDGTVRFLYSRGEVELDHACAPTRVFGYTQDVTERVHVERALIETQDNLAAELAGMARLQDVSTQLVQSGDGSVLLDEILDAAIAITAADMGCIQLLDGEPPALGFVASRGFDDAFLSYFGSGHSACGAAVKYSTRIVVDDVTTSPVFAGTPDLDAIVASGVRALQSTPLISRSGRVVGVLSTHYKTPRFPADRDLRVLDMLSRQAADWLERQQVKKEREQLLEREQRARAEAERATQLKDDFLATLSHELRTPLSVILGWTDVIRADIGDHGRVERGVDVIAHSARTQNQLVADLLDLSRITAGKLRLNVSRVYLPDVVKSAVDAIGPLAIARGIRIECVIEPITESVHGDAARLQQVVWNLLSNAVKFTPVGGRIQVVLARVNSHAEISVSDTGKGISPDFLPKVFERFRQQDASAAREHGGLGIGLALVKELTDLHGGHVRVHSEGEGRGATFAIELPLAIMQDTEGAVRLHPRIPASLSMGDSTELRLTGVKVLVVDDEPAALEVIQRILQDRGAEAVAVPNVDAALAVLAETSFDVLLSDIGMPKRDGYELITEVRRRGIMTPAAAVTAFARSEDRTRAFLAGYQAHIAKPLEASELLATVASLARRIT